MDPPRGRCQGKLRVYALLAGKALVNYKGKGDRSRQGELSECDAGVLTCEGRQGRKDGVGRVSNHSTIEKISARQTWSPQAKVPCKGNPLWGRITLLEIHSRKAKPYVHVKTWM